MPGLTAHSFLQDTTILKLSFQCVELLCSDFMHVLPKEVIQMALRVLSLFAKQVRVEV
jgi:hypothetical protein